MESIPDIADPERYTEQDFTNSGFVEIASNQYFDVQMQYPLLGMKNKEEQCLVREEVYEMLVRAAKTLPGDCKFRILDAWRPFALQQELYTSYSADIIRKFGLENCSNDQKQAVIRKFVSLDRFLRGNKSEQESDVLRNWFVRCSRS